MTAEHHGQDREVKPEVELLRQARAGDSRAAIELLMWSRWMPTGAIDPAVHEALVQGALDVAFYVANEVKQKGSGRDGAKVPVKPLMFFNGVDPKARANPGLKGKEEVERIIGAIIANGDLPYDKDRLTQDDLKEALTTNFHRPGLPLKNWPKLYRDVEARLIEYIRWKHSRDVPSEAEDMSRRLIDIDEELCQGLISISFQQHQWHRDRLEEFPYPEHWRTAESPGQ